jgi:hypothetical protein
VERSKFDNVRTIESIFIQGPDGEKSYFPAFAVIKLNKLVITEENKFSTVTISSVFGGLGKFVRNDLHYSQFFDSKKLKLILNLSTINQCQIGKCKLRNLIFCLQTFSIGLIKNENNCISQNLRKKNQSS